MKELSFRPSVQVSNLPVVSSTLAGTIVLLTTDNKPYWCDGAAWIDLSASSSATPGGASGEVQFNNAGSFGGASNVKIDNGDLCFAKNNTPVAPPQTLVKLFGEQIGGNGGRVIPGAVDSSGMGCTLQPSIWRQGISFWRPGGNSSAPPGVLGFTALAIIGTATARSVATTNTLTRAKRLGYVSGVAAGNMCGHYSTTAQYTLGTGAVGGFLYSCRFGVSDATLVAGARSFIGVSSSTAAPTNVDPATLTNCIGIGHTAADTSWFIYSGGSVAQARINLGAIFPINTTSLIDFTIWSPPNQNGVAYYNVELVGAGVMASGQLGPGTAGTTLPANTTLLAHRAWRTNNATATAVGIDIASVYFETDW